MDRTWVRRGVISLVFLLVGLALGGSASAGSQTLRMVPLVEHWDGSSWTQVKVAPPGAPLVQLNAVVAPSASQAWAFGYTRYAQHWNGTVWTRVTLPVPTGVNSPEFDGAVATSPHDVWAVGNALHEVFDHWNGHTWRMVPSHLSHCRILGMTALSSKDVWAVGQTRIGTSLRTLTVHWNGTAWKRIPSPSPATPSTPAGSIVDSLAAVAGDSSHDVWAVGSYYRLAPDGEHAMHPLVLRWNGARWTQVPSPDPAGAGHRSFLFGVTAPSSTGVWAVGSAARHGNQHALAEHWDGAHWNIVPTTRNPLFGVSGLSASDVWAAGGWTSGDVEHWDGNAWTIQTKLVHDDALMAIAEVSPTDVWAVGVQFVS